MLRSEVVSVRLDSKLMLATRLAAAHERRALASFVEWAVGQAVQRIGVSVDEDGKEMNARAVAEQVWDPDEAKRLLNLAILHPNLLTHEEEQVWKYIWYSAAFSRPRPKGKWLDEAAYIDWDAVHKHWATLQRVASGQAPASELPKGETIAESKPSIQKRGRIRD